MAAFFISLFLQLVVAFLAPKPKIPNAKRYSLNEFTFPTATEDRAQQYGVGTFQANGNVIWADDYYAQAVTEEVSTGLFSSQTITKGYRYHVGMWLTLTGVTCDEVTEIRLGDQVVWSGKLVLSKTAPTTLDVDASWSSTEDQEIADGMFGRFVFFNRALAEGADYVPAPNAYLEQQLGVGKVPEYPNTLHVLWLGPSAGSMPVPGKTAGVFGRRTEFRKFGFLGTSPQIPALTISLGRKPDVSVALPTGRDITFPVVGNTHDANVRAALDAFIAANSDIEGDANPAFVELELLTSRSPGLGPRLSPWAVEVEAYLKSAQRLKNEGHGISFPWEASQPVSELLSDIGQQANSFFELNERTGQLRTKLVRSDDVPVMTFDENNITSIGQLERVMADQAPNLIEVPWIDRANGWIQRVSQVKNPAGRKAAGSVITYRAEYRGVTREPVAAILGSRLMRQHASPLAKLPWTATVPVGTVLKPGDLVIVRHPSLKQTLRMRIASARFASFQSQLSVDLEGLEDVFRDGLASYATDAPPLPGQGAAVPPASLVNGQALQAPYALTGDDGDHVMYVGDDPGTATSTYRLALQKIYGWDGDNGVNIYVDNTQEPAITGSLNTLFTSLQVSPQLSLTLTAAAAEQWARRPRGPLYVLAGNEWMTCDGWTLTGATLTATNVTRAIFDTVPQRLGVGSIVRILLGYVIYPARLKTAPGGGLPVIDGLENCTLRTESRGAGGVLSADAAPASEARWQFATATCRAPRPLPPAYIRLDGLVGPLSDAETPPSVSRAASVGVAWTNRNRLTRGTSSYFSTSGDSEPNVRTSCVLEYLADNNQWATTKWQVAAAGATSAIVDTSTNSVPAGARALRIRIRSERVVSTNNYVASADVLAYFQVTS